MKPTFIGIGAQKCASTWLYRILQSHPQIGVSDIKEIDFFSYHFDHGYQWYENHFSKCKQDAVIGEISPSYFCEPAVPERVYNYAPSAKILVSLRDPVVRALSNHRHEVRVGHITGKDLSFSAGLANNPMYIEQGRYATHIKRWLQYYSQEQILVLLMEDIEKDPLSIAKRVYSFLGVAADYEPQQASEYFNRSYANRFSGLTRLKDSSYNIIKKSGLERIWSFCASVGLRNIYRRFNTMPSEIAIPSPDEKILRELRNRFRPEISELSQLIGRSLDTWM